jgi:hypothetical protein
MINATIDHSAAKIHLISSGIIQDSRCSTNALGKKGHPRMNAAHSSANSALLGNKRMHQCQPRLERAAGAKTEPLLRRVSSGPSALQRFVDGEFGIHHRVAPGKCDASPHSGCVEKDDPFPAKGICRLNDFKLNSFVFHGRISNRDRGRCCSDGKGHDCKSKSDEFQAVSVRHFDPPSIKIITRLA